MYQKLFTHRQVLSIFVWLKMGKPATAEIYKKHVSDWKKKKGNIKEI